MLSPQLVYKGSSKDIFKFNEEYLFKFSDRYSIFDWGEMPDLIPSKGQSLSIFTKKIYDHFSKVGIKNHLISNTKNIEEIIVKPFKVQNEQITYNDENVFIPLEFIFRFGAAKGSSILKRIKNESEWLAAGFDRKYFEGEKFSTIHIDYTTKLERIDRPLLETQAMQVAGATIEEWALINLTVRKIAAQLKEIFEKLEIEIWDGKCELAFGFKNNEIREIILVDSIGPDELRLTKNDCQLSKELLRQYYLQSNWYSNLDFCKKNYAENFKKICVEKFDSKPQALPENIIKLTSELYDVLSMSILEVSEFRIAENKIKLDKLINNLKEVMK